MTFDRKEYNRQWTQNNLERLNELQKKRRKLKSKSELKEYDLQRRYGISLDDFNQMILDQNGKCAICLIEFGDTTLSRPNIDHDHVSGDVRSILCFTCNTTLGKIGESRKTLSNAITYLQKFELQRQINNVRGKLEKNNLCNNTEITFDEILHDYSQYVERQMSTIFSFEDWIAQTNPDVDISKLKWITLKI